MEAFLLAGACSQYSSGPLTVFYNLRCSDVAAANRSLLNEVEAALRLGSGVALLRPEDDQLSNHDLTRAAWDAFSTLCTPMQQYSSGELICDVRVSEERLGVSSYLTSDAEGGFHTDGTLLPRTPEVCALLGLQSASVGGATILVDASRIYAELSLLFPQEVQMLLEPFPFEARGQCGLELVKWQPIFRLSEIGVEATYLRHFVDRGFALVGTKPPEPALAMLDALTSLLVDPTPTYSSILQRGEFLLWRNSSFFHGRARFVNSASEHRHLRRFYGIWP